MSTFIVQSGWNSIKGYKNFANMRGVCITTVGTVMIQKQKHFTVNILKHLNKSMKGAKRKHHVRPAAQSNNKTIKTVKQEMGKVHSLDKMPSPL